VQGFDREREEGSVEYKLKIVGVDRERLENLATQMKYRVLEGGGEAIYEIGVTNDGQLIGMTDEELRESLQNIDLVASKIGVKTTLLREVRGKRGKVVEILVRRSKDEDGFPIYLMIPVLGQVDAGKSTTISVLCSGELDDGNGLGMSRIARYLHEIKMRRTSSISSHLLGFTEQGGVVNYAVPSPLSEAEVYLNSAKVASFIDLGGHERYLRTTLKGVMGHVPDYVMLIVGANAGIQQMTREHLGVSLALKIPIFVVVTKAEMVPPASLENVIFEVQRYLKLPSVDKIPVLIKGMEDVIVTAKNMSSSRIAPIFTISNTTGKGLDLVRAFLNLLPQRLRWDEQEDNPFLLYIDDKFDVKGVGSVVSGVVLQGSVAVDQQLQMGPFGDRTFRKVRIRSIQVNRVGVKKAVAGQDACLALSNVRYEDIHKGMVLLDPSATVKPTNRFRADIMVLYHRTTIREGYEATFHINTIRQAGRFVKLSKDPLRSGDRATITVEMLHRPVYLLPGQQLVFREGHTRGIGTVTEVV